MIEVANVSLRPIELDDAHRMLRWMQDPTVRLNVGVCREPSLERTLAWIRRSLTEPTMCARAILDDGEHAGNVVLDQIDGSARRARLSIYIGAADRRQRGLGREAIRLILREAFEELDLDNVWLTVSADNEPAIRCYSAVGFRTVETIRNGFRTSGVTRDEVKMVIRNGDVVR